ncbi:DNA double-strand break repair nuclease NurA [Thermoproteus uzoniensis]|uniref:DNA double-strand break repair nuclease NurA n=1 Tax=Thermoproteus uzoniensis TaxID=184117 RepID=UPI00069BE93D|nr:DNA double-strand break repair nuclease NurA [Thermoproteus uzoniensis]
MDHFFDLFVQETRGRIAKYVEYRRSEPSLDFLLSRIPVERAPEAEADLPAVAVDGGIGVVELDNGHKILLARAAAVGRGMLKREFLADVLAVDSSAVSWAYLIMAEALAAAAAVEEGGFDYLLMDGSLYAKAIMLAHNLILTREFQSIFYVPEMIAALYALAHLLERAEEAGIKAVFVSKDSRFKVLKEYAAFEALRGRLDDYIVERGLRWYSVMWLRRFRKAIFSAYQKLRGDREAQAALDALFRQSVADPVVLWRMEARSYTTPMLLGACDAYMNYKGLTSVSRLLDAVADRVEDALAFRGERTGSASEYLEKARKALSTLPKILMFYLKPAQGSEPLLVETPLPNSRMFDGAPVKAFYPQASVDDVVSLLLAQYRDEAHYNYWLWYAHEVASFKSGQLAEYAVYIKQMLRGAGVSTARRVKMAMGL